MLGGRMGIKLGDADQRSKAPCPQIIAWSPLSLIYLADANENLSVEDLQLGVCRERETRNAEGRAARKAKSRGM
ncbi:hypothetical protein CEXT_676041, partial [Caerostris extrusa]